MKTQPEIDVNLVAEILTEEAGGAKLATIVTRYISEVYEKGGSVSDSNTFVDRLLEAIKKDKRFGILEYQNADGKQGWRSKTFVYFPCTSEKDTSKK